MTKHEQIYKLLGVRNNGRLAEPVSVNREDFSFPHKSIYVWNTDDAIPSVPALDRGVVKNTKFVKMLIIPEYYKPVGRLKMVKNEHHLLSELKDITDIRIYENPSKIRIITPDTLLLVNSSIVRYAYRYQPYLTARYDETFNRLKALSKTIKFDTLTKDRVRYININIGRIKPDFLNNLKKSLKVQPKAILDLFEHDFELVLMFLGMLLNPNTRTKSPFNILSENEMKITNFIFQRGTKMTLFNLFDMVAMVKDYNLEGRLRAVESDVAIKLFVLFLFKFGSSYQESISDINKKSIDVKAIDGKELEKQDKDVVENVDALLHDEGSSHINDDIEEEVDDVITINNKLKSIDDIQFKETPMTTILDKAETEGFINASSKSKVQTILDQQISGGITAEINITPEELKIPEDLKKLPDLEQVPSKDMFNDTLHALDSHYIKKIYERDIKSVVYGFQKAGVIVESYEVKQHKNIVNEWDELTVKLTPLDGKTSTIRIPIPTLHEDGTIRNNGNRYTMVRQISDIPIRKINQTTVVLNSYVGRITVSKAKYNVQNLGKYINRQLNKMADIPESGVSIVINLPLDIIDQKIPLLYGQIVRATKAFVYKGYQISFDYHSRHIMVNKEDRLEDIEKHGILFGKNGKKYLVMDKDSMSHIVEGKKVTDIGYLPTWMKMDMSKAPKEFTSIQVFKEIVPTAIILTYYLGLNQLLSALKVKVTEYEPRKRFETKLDDVVIKMDDMVLHIEEMSDLARIILSGFHNNNRMKEIIYSEMIEDSDTMLVMYGLSNRHIGEIKANKHLFVDPITKTVLTDLGYPITLSGLFIKASELLINDDYTHTNKMDEMMIRGYERIPGMLYNVMAKAIKQQKASNSFRRSPVVVKPYDVWNLLVSDSTLMLSEDINPIASRKQTHEITYTGFGGRDIQTMVPKTREFHKSSIGVISTDTKDSGKVGVTIYASSDPLLATVRGVPKKVDNYEDKTISNKFSNSVLISSFATHDDSKRMGFIDIMNGHVIGNKNYVVLPIRTGNESVFPEKCSADFCLVAKDEGVVLNVSDKFIEVSYKKLGIKKYPLKTWFSKEESGTCYKHELITDLKPKDKFVPGDALYYDEMFFGRDMLRPKGIAYKMGMVVKTAYDESYGTFEDSYILTNSGRSKVDTNVVKVRTKRLTASSEIFKVAKVGDKVDSSDILLQFGEGDYNENNIFDTIKENNMKSDYKGVIKRILCYYNCSKEDMSKSVKSFITKTDKDLMSFNNNDITGEVDGSYSESGTPLEEGEIIIKIYIDVNNNASFGDKVVFGNQLKTTLGEVRDGEYTYNDRPIDCFFSTVSEEARIVESATVQGLLNTLLIQGTNKFLEIFDNE